MSGQPVSIGRFRLALPGGLVIAGREQIVYAVKVWTTPALWQSRLEELGPRVKSKPDLGDGINAVWYEERSVQLLEAAKSFGDHSIRLLRDAPDGKEQTAEKLAGNIIRGYHPSTESGFCIGAGAIRLGPAQVETTRLSLNAPGNPALEVEFTTQTVTTPDTKQYMDANEEREVMAELKGRLTVFREARRVVAGMEGMEIHLSMAPPGEPEIIRYTWHFPGVPGDGTQPRLNLVAFSSPEQHQSVSELREALEESNLPFRVDLFVWDEIPPQFRKTIHHAHVVLTDAQNSHLPSSNSH